MFARTCFLSILTYLGQRSRSRTRFELFFVFRPLFCEKWRSRHGTKFYMFLEILPIDLRHYLKFRSHVITLKNEVEVYLIFSTFLFFNILSKFFLHYVRITSQIPHVKNQNDWVSHFSIKSVFMTTSKIPL